MRPTLSGPSFPTLGTIGEMMDRLIGASVTSAIAIGLAVIAALPGQAAWFGLTAVIVVFGVPHGALDGEVARPMLRPRFGRSWFLVFAPTYLALSVLVLFAWRVSPTITLAAFLALSTLHFGMEDAARGRGARYWTEVLVRGGLPIALPLLLRPAATTAVFAAATQAPLPVPPMWLLAASLIWAVAATGWMAAEARRAGIGALHSLIVPIAAFVVLPPLAAFTLYFVAFHAPAHMRATILAPHHAPRVRDLPSAIGYSLPLTVVTIVFGACLWPFYQGSEAVRALGLTLQVLSALTLPHMLLDAAAVCRSELD